jgi:sugar-specific transcriptional regulator TrmB
MISPIIFEQLGFTKKETIIYLALLELDSATPSELSKKTNINRTSCYDILEILMKKGLIGKYKKRGKIYFQAGDPKHLVEYLEREREEFDKKIKEQQKAIQEILPELSSLLHPKKTKPKITFFEGEKGMREAYEDTLNSQEIILAYANVETMHEGLPQFFPEYYKRRANAGIPIRAIIPNNPLSNERAKHNKQELRETRIIQDPSLTFSPEMNIYEDKVLIASWKEKMVVLIKSKEFAHLQKIIYQLLWDTMKEKNQTQ